MLKVTSSNGKVNRDKWKTTSGKWKVDASVRKETSINRNVNSGDFGWIKS